MPRTKKAARLKRLQAQDRDQAPHHSSPDPHQTMSNHNPQTSANMQFTTKVKPSRNERRKKRKNTRKAVLHKPANPSIPPKDSCPFLEAPAEIRVEIYRHLMEFYCLLLHIGSAYNDEETGGYHRGFPLIHRPINMQQVLTTLLTCSTIRSELFPVIAESAYVRVVAKGCKWTDLPKYFRRNILPKVQQAEILAFSSWFPFSMMKGLKKVVLTGEDVQVATPLRIEKSTIEELVPYLVGDQDQMLFDEHIRNCLRADEDSSKPSRANLLFKVQELSKQGVEVHIACRVKLLMSIVEEGTHVSRVPVSCDQSWPFCTPANLHRSPSLGISIRRRLCAD